MFAKRFDVMSAFDAIERIGRDKEDADGKWREPTFDVRLDGKRQLEARSYRIRVTAGSRDGNKVPTFAEWREVLEIGERFDAHVVIDNSAMELT